MNAGGQDAVIDMDKFKDINKYLPVLKYAKMAESRTATQLMSAERKRERKVLFGKLVSHFVEWRKLQKLVLCFGLSREREEELKEIHAPLTQKNVEVFLDFSHFLFGRI